MTVNTIDPTGGGLVSPTQDQHPHPGTTDQPEQPPSRAWVSPGSSSPVAEPIPHVQAMQGPPSRWCPAHTTRSRRAGGSLSAWPRNASSSDAPRSPRSPRSPPSRNLHHHRSRTPHPASRRPARLGRACARATVPSSIRPCSPDDGLGADPATHQALRTARVTGMAGPPPHGGRRPPPPRLLDDARSRPPVHPAGAWVATGPRRDQPASARTWVGVRDGGAVRCRRPGVPHRGGGGAHQDRRCSRPGRTGPCRTSGRGR